MGRNKEIDFDAIHSMSEEQQQQVYYTLAKRANQRFRDITKAGEQSGAATKAQKWLVEEQGRTTFKQSTKLTGIELKENLKALETFYTSKSATVKGIRQIQAKKIESFENNFESQNTYDEFKKLMKDKDFKKKFYQFLASNEFKTLSKYADSDQIIEDYVQALDEGFSLEHIMEGYTEFLNNDMTFEQVAERRRVGGELLQ